MCWFVHKTRIQNPLKQPWTWTVSPDAQQQQQHGSVSFFSTGSFGSYRWQAFYKQVKQTNVTQSRRHELPPSTIKSLCLRLKSVHDKITDSLVWYKGRELQSCWTNSFCVSEGNVPKFEKRCLCGVSALEGGRVWWRDAIQLHCGKLQIEYVWSMTGTKSLDTFISHLQGCEIMNLTHE